MNLLSVRNGARFAFAGAALMTATVLTVAATAQADGTGTCVAPCRNPYTPPSTTTTIVTTTTTPVTTTPSTTPVTTPATTTPVTTPATTVPAVVVTTPTDNGGGGGGTNVTNPPTPPSGTAAPQTPTITAAPQGQTGGSTAGSNAGTAGTAGAAGAQNTNAQAQPTSADVNATVQDPSFQSASANAAAQATGSTGPSAASKLAAGAAGVFGLAGTIVASRRKKAGTKGTRPAAAVKGGKTVITHTPKRNKGLPAANDLDTLFGPISVRQLDEAELGSIRPTQVIEAKAREAVFQ